MRSSCDLLAPSGRRRDRLLAPAGRVGGQQLCVLLLLESEPLTRVHLGGPDGFGAEPGFDPFAKPGVVAQAKGEAHVAQLDAEASEELAQRPQTLQLGRAVEAVT